MDTPSSWMIRTSQNVIHGPYSRDEIVDFIKTSKLTTLDEVCNANHYWFFLHEANEVVTQLGTQPPQPAPSPEDEITETEIRTPSGVSSKSATPEPGSELVDYEDEDTGAHLKGRKKPEEPASEAAQALERAMKASRMQDDTRSDFMRRIEGISFWKGLTLFLTVVFVVLLLSVFRLIRNP